MKSRQPLGHKVREREGEISCEDLNNILHVLQKSSVLKRESDCSKRYVYT